MSAIFVRRTMLRQSTKLIARRISALRDFSTGTTTTATPAAASSGSGSSSSGSSREVDVLIVGGGVVGAALAMQLQTVMSVALVEAGQRPPPTSPTQHQESVPSPRSYALSPASLDILKIRPQSGYYDSMQVWEAQQPASILWGANDLQNDSKFLGCCVEDSVLQEHLWNQLGTTVQTFTETKAESIQWPTESDGWVEGTLTPSSSSDAPSRIRTRLVVAADGARSQIRQVAGIAMHSLEYDQAALTFTVLLTTCEARRMQRAYQRFVPTGPLALLPSRSASHGVIVWSTTAAEAARWKEEDPVQVVEHLNDLLQTGPEQLPRLFPSCSDPTILSNLAYGVQKVVDTIQYGTTMAAQQGIFSDENSTVFQAPPKIQSIVSPRFSFPLQCQIPVNSKYTVGNHLALVGDAAHSVHPMAGQGLNLGLQDVQALVQTIRKAVDAGMDPGTFLSEYNHSRRQQVNLTVAGIHGLQRMFAQQHVLLKHAKSLGMNLVQNLAPVRRALVQAASQGVAVP
jgi:ubiquinone biosynthesis monooxygenase Coq6